jgi:hypothetical protein
MQAGDVRPSYDEPAALVARQAAVIEQLRAEVVALRAENAELNVGGDEFDELAEAAVVGFAVVKPAPKSLRRRRKRKPDDQAGPRRVQRGCVSDGSRLP